jgi:tRNA pseudouridine13 synthase
MLNPLDPPKLLGLPLGAARFKSRAEDFQVEEILGFDPSDEGEHCFLWLEKTGRNTVDVATALASKLGIRNRHVSHCGLKDKNAVTRQWFSLHLPGQASPVLSDLDIDGVRVLKITRNLRKLHRGSHDGNRFVVRLRDCLFSKDAAAERWQKIVDHGVPNYFGPQRFGRDGGNMRTVRHFMSGNLETKDRLLRGILISAARSFVFNACVAERVQRGNWDTPLDGEVFGFANNRSLVLPENLRGDESQRVTRGTLELTAPLWGEDELGSQQQVKAIEEHVAESYSEIIGWLAQFNLKQERRVMRLRPQSPKMTWETPSTLVLRFDLSKGTYATTLLRELVDFANGNNLLAARCAHRQS